MSNIRTTKLLVTIQEDSNGQVWSDHAFASEQDVASAKQMKASGAWAIAHGLLLEAIRREAFATSLVLLSHKKISMETLSETSELISRMTKDNLFRIIEKVTVECTSQVTQMLKDQYENRT